MCLSKAPTMVKPGPSGQPDCEDRWSRSPMAAPFQWTWCGNSNARGNADFCPLSFVTRTRCRIRASSPATTLAKHGRFLHPRLRRSRRPANPKLPNFPTARCCLRCEMNLARVKGLGHASNRKRLYPRLVGWVAERLTRSDLHGKFGPSSERSTDLFQPGIVQEPGRHNAACER